MLNGAAVSNVIRRVYMKLIREGKTKTVFEADGGNILLKFKDDVTERVT